MRSGLAAINGLFTVGGIIDNDYTGSIKVLMLNSSKSGYKLNKGDQIAKMNFILKPEIVNIQNNKKIKNTTFRGNNKFGSTGK